MATYYTNWSFSNSSTPNKETYVVNGANKTYYNDVRYKFVTSEKVDVKANKSIFTVKKYAVFYYTWEDTGNVDINVTLRSKMGSAGYQSDSTVLVPSSSASDYYLVGTDTFQITHKADGTGTTSFVGDGSYVGGSGTTYKRSVSKSNIALAEINRGSTITSNASETTKFGDTIEFAITKIVQNEVLTHDITYSMYNASGTIATNVDSTYSWQIPIELVKSSPDNAEPIITINCITKNGDTTIGSNSYSFKCLVPTNYKPTATLELEESGDVPKEWGIYVETKSRITGTITTGVNVEGDTATIKSYLTDSGVNKYLTNPFQTNYIVESGNYEIKTQVTDSRGRVSDYNENNTKLIEVLPYTIPTIKLLKVYRCDSNGNPNENGTYAKATIEYEISSLNNKNTKILKVSANNQSETITPSAYSGTHTFSKIFSGFNTDETYTFLFTVGDYFNDNIQQQAILSPSFITESKLRGGKGITYGRNATEEGIHSYMDVEHHTNTKVKNLNVSGMKIEKYNEVFIAYIEEV